MGTIEPRSDDRGDEELRAVGVLAGVGHGEDTGLGVLQLEVLILELLAVDRLSTGAVSTSEVTTLEHELYTKKRARSAVIMLEWSGVSRYVRWG